MNDTDTLHITLSGSYLDFTFSTGRDPFPDVWEDLAIIPEKWVDDLLEVLDDEILPDSFGGGLAVWHIVNASPNSLTSTELAEALSGGEPRNVLTLRYSASGDFELVGEFSPHLIIKQEDRERRLSILKKIDDRVFDGRIFTTAKAYAAESARSRGQACVPFERDSPLHRWEVLYHALRSLR